jgi:cell shape-determining protein MreC
MLIYCSLVFFCLLFLIIFTNTVLKTQLAELNAQLGALTELKLENERLSQLLGFKQASKMNLLAARQVLLTWQAVELKNFR